MAKNICHVVMNIKVKLSLWDAIKLRIAGAKHIHEIVKKMAKKK